MKKRGFSFCNHFENISHDMEFCAYEELFYRHIMLRDSTCFISAKNIHIPKILYRD